MFLLEDGKNPTGKLAHCQLIRENRLLHTRFQVKRHTCLIVLLLFFVVFSEINKKISSVDVSNPLYSNVLMPA